jgi:hypothetical protein
VQSSYDSHVRPSRHLSKFVGDVGATGAGVLACTTRPQGDLGSGDFMSRSVKDQVKSGLRLGGGVAVFLVTMAPLADGLRRVVWAAPPHQLLWSSIGLAEIIVAAGLLISTAQVWVHFFGGCMLVGTIKGVFALMVGTSIPRLELAWAVVIFSVTLVLLVAIISRGTPLLDRIALTVYVFSLGWSADKGLFTPSPSLAVGLAALLVSWCLYYWRPHGQ